MLEKIADPSLRVYVVWLPILGNDARSGALGITVAIPDLRAIHFWNQDQRLGKIYAEVLGLTADQCAWDVYLLFPRGVRWEADAPTPVYWMHQLTYPSDNYLDGDKFRKEVEKRLQSSAKSPRAGLLSGPDEFTSQSWAAMVRSRSFCIDTWEELYRG